VDDTVVASNIGREILVLSEGLLSNDSVVDEILTELTGVGKRLSVDGGKSGGSYSRRGNSSLNNAEGDCGSIERSTGKLVRLNSGISRSENSERSGSSKGVSNTALLKTLNEESEVIVSLKVSLLETSSDSISSPNLSRALESSKGVYEVSIKSSGTCLYQKFKKGGEIL
jgi:hypothetical protein